MLPRQRLAVLSRDDLTRVRVDDLLAGVLRGANDVRLDRLVAVGEHADRGTVLGPVEGEAGAAAEVPGRSLGNGADPDVSVRPDVRRAVGDAFSGRVVAGATDENLGNTEHFGRSRRAGVEDRVARETSAAEAVNLGCPQY